MRRVECVQQAGAEQAAGPRDRHGNRGSEVRGSRRWCNAPAPCRRSPRRGRSPVEWGLDTPGARTQVAPSTASFRAAAPAGRECEVMMRRPQQPRLQENGTRMRGQQGQHTRSRQQHELPRRLQQRGRLVHLPPDDGVVEDDHGDEGSNGGDGRGDGHGHVGTRDGELVASPRGSEGGEGMAIEGMMADWRWSAPEAVTTKSHFVRYLRDHQVHFVSTFPGCTFCTSLHTDLRRIP